MEVELIFIWCVFFGIAIAMHRINYRKKCDNDDK